MIKPDWPAADKRALIGKRISRIDGPQKTSGTAKYTYDINRPGLLFVKLLGSRHASAKIKSIDLGEADAMPGVRATWRDEGMLTDEVQYAGQILAAVAADTEEIATEALGRIKVEYEPLTPQVVDSKKELASGKPDKREVGDVTAALQSASAVSQGAYGIPVVTHCCLESHGQVSEPRDGELYLWGSTQNVSGYADQMDQSVNIPQSKIHTECQYVGGGFGSKFSYDKWGIICAQLAQKTGKPCKLMLDRNLELMIAGNRPSTYANIGVGLDKEGTIVAFDAEAWGTGGAGGFKAPPMPYVFTKIKNQRIVGTGIKTHRGGQRAWRAPSHPQGCLVTMAALDDAAAKLGMDSLEFFLHNLNLTDQPDVYKQELAKAAELIGYKEKAHLRTNLTPGPVKRGLGISMHMWGGMGHPSNCDTTIHPDGSVEVKLGSQDLGTGTRTVIDIVVAETLGLRIDQVQVKLGSNAYPQSGGSGGSTTVGGVSASSRLSATAALNKLLEVVAPKLGVSADALEARDGVICDTAKPDNKIAWKDACSLLGAQGITERGTNNGGESKRMGLIDGGVGGVQMADVSVDVETGVVTINEMVAVQDCGLVIDLKTAESQVYSGLIMGITYALFEEALYDPTTGRMLNADMEFYRLAGLKDIGQLKVHMMSGAGFDERGVIGLGEPPVISPGAAISNAVANAIGVRVPNLPMTPNHVLAALHPELVKV